jgi:hypothetical protein
VRAPRESRSICGPTVSAIEGAPDLLWMCVDGVRMSPSLCIDFGHAIAVTHGFDAEMEFADVVWRRPPDWRPPALPHAHLLRTQDGGLRFEVVSAGTSGDRAVHCEGRLIPLAADPGRTTQANDDASGAAVATVDMSTAPRGTELARVLQAAVALCSAGAAPTSSRGPAHGRWAPRRLGRLRLLRALTSALTLRLRRADTISGADLDVVDAEGFTCIEIRALTAAPVDGGDDLASARAAIAKLLLPPSPSEDGDGAVIARPASSAPRSDDVSPPAKGPTMMEKPR